MPKKIALISVFDKTGVEAFAAELAALGFGILSTGGTASLLRRKGVPVTEVSDYTGFPEMMDGRVKTLHPKVHGGILGRAGHREDLKSMGEHGIDSIDLVLVNLYPFEKVASDPGASRDEIIENIDVGGPCLIRAAAKNHQRVAVLTDPADYPEALSALKRDGAVPDDLRKRLAGKAFLKTSRYDAAIADFFGRPGEKIGDGETPRFEAGEELRYGENPHQSASLIPFPGGGKPLRNAEVISGKQMSYNNYLDADSALASVADLPPDKPSACVVKHGNPCGLACAENLETALELAWEGDPVSAFGGVIAVNGTFDLACAEFIKGENRKHKTYQLKDGEYVAANLPGGKFVELVLAPDFTPEAVDLLRSKSSSVRLVRYDPNRAQEEFEYRGIAGGMLKQSADRKLLESVSVATRKEFEFSSESLIPFGLVAVKNAKSNSVALVRETPGGGLQLLGLGAGQPNRVDALRKLAVPKAVENLKRELPPQISPELERERIGEELAKCLLVSEAFFPFADTVETAAAAGIRNIVQPGGSVRDGDSIRRCDELGVAMALTGVRHFKH